MSVRYVEELHEPHGFDQFLTDAECREVAAHIDSLGPNPERATEFFTHPSALGDLQRNPSTGWNTDDVLEAHQAAERRATGNDLPDYVREIFTLLRVLVDYLDKLHGFSGFREVLTPDEGRDVGNLVSRLLSNPPKN